MNVSINMMMKTTLTTLNPPEHLPEVHQIYRIVCAYYKLPVILVNLPSRKRIYSQVRQVTHFICKQLLDKKVSMSVVGLVVGNKDHATVINSVRAINNLISPMPNGAIQNEQLRRDVAILTFKCKQAIEGLEYTSMGTMITNQN